MADLKSGLPKGTSAADLNEWKANLIEAIRYTLTGKLNTPPVELGERYAPPPEPPMADLPADAPAGGMISPLVNALRRFRTGDPVKARDVGEGASIAVPVGRGGILRDRQNKAAIDKALQDANQ
jgi:hypothetical protein